MFRFTASRMLSATALCLGQTGKVVSFNRQKGFGFVECGEGDDKKTHFLHFSALQVEGGYKAVDIGTTVEFEVAPDERDPSRTRAVNVTAPGGAPLPAPERRYDQQGGGRGRGRGDGGFRGRGRGDGNYRGGRGRGDGGYRGRGDGQRREQPPADEF